MIPLKATDDAVDSGQPTFDEKLRIYEDEIDSLRYEVDRLHRQLQHAALSTIDKIDAPTVAGQAVPAPSANAEGEGISLAATGSSVMNVLLASQGRSRMTCLLHTNGSCVKGDS